MSFCYYFDVPFEETMRRHATKPRAAEYGFAEMSDWYRPLDLLPDGGEQIISAEMSLDDTVSKMMADAGLPCRVRGSMSTVFLAARAVEGLLPPRDRAISMRLSKSGYCRPAISP